MTYDTWHETPWHITCETWHDMTCNRWGEVNLLLKYQLPSSSGLGVKVFWRFWRKRWLNYLLNKKSVCRPALATSGLLKHLVIMEFPYPHQIILGDMSFCVFPEFNFNILYQLKRSPQENWYKYLWEEKEDKERNNSIITSLSLTAQAQAQEKLSFLQMYKGIIKNLSWQLFVILILKIFLLQM